jgi:sugar phosphate isomerase/epimerase
LRLGIFASELVKVICNRPLGDIKGSKLREAASKAINLMRKWGLGCAEFGLTLEQLQEIVKVTAEEDGMDFLLHELTGYSAARLTYADPEASRQILDGLKETIDYASKGGFTVLTIHPAFYNPRRPGYAYQNEAEKYPEPKDARAKSIKLLRELTEYAERRGVILGLENMPSHLCIDGEVLKTPHFGKTRSEFTRILSEVDMEGLKMTFDVGHANTICQPADYIRGMVDAVVHIHIHDNDGRYDQHAALGLGTVNFISLFKVLRDEGYDGPITIERAIDENMTSDLYRLRCYVSGNLRQPQL